LSIEGLLVGSQMNSQTVKWSDGQMKLLYMKENHNV